MYALYPMGFLAGLLFWLLITYLDKDENLVPAKIKKARR